MATAAASTAGVAASEAGSGTHTASASAAAKIASSAGGGASDGLSDSAKSAIQAAVSGSGTELSLVDLDLVQLPGSVATARGSSVKSLNLSENKLQTGLHLDKFPKLDTLVLDKNELTGLDFVPAIPSLTTLWFNNNKMDDLPDFLDNASSKFPRLTYLSLMRNPAVPSIMCMSEEDAASQKRYRLTFLDSSPVTKEEREEAAVKGQYLMPRKPKKKKSKGKRSSSSASSGQDGALRLKSGSNAASGHATAAAAAGGGVGAGGGAGSAGDDARRPSAYLGLGGSNYDGRHSEGNRFIVDENL